jgi:hypothetical protein
MNGPCQTFPVGPSQAGLATGSWCALWCHRRNPIGLHCMSYPTNRRISCYVPRPLGRSTEQTRAGEWHAELGWNGGDGASLTMLDITGAFVTTALWHNHST